MLTALFVVQMNKFKVTPDPLPNSRRDRSSRNPPAPAVISRHPPSSNPYNSNPTPTSGYSPSQYMTPATGNSRNQSSSSNAPHPQPASQQYGHYPQPSASTSTPSQIQRAFWVMEILAYPWNGAPLARRMPIERGQMPQTTCACGCEATIRILHLPTVANWQPPFGVLWNFINPSNGANNWLEGVARDNSISAAQCPYCSAYITLYGPSDFHAMV